MEFFRTVFQLGTDFGLFDVLVPFILTYIIVFSLLRQTKILGEHKGYQIAVAGILGAFVVASIQVSQSVVLLFSYGGLAIILLILVFIVARWLAGGPTENEHKAVAPFVFAILFGIVLYIINEVGWWDRFMDFVPMLLVVGVILFVFWYIFHEPKKPKKPAQPAVHAPQRMPPQLMPEQVSGEE